VSWRVGFARIIRESKHSSTYSIHRAANMSGNVCQQCGACCATYRVTFSAAELDDESSDGAGRPGHVPAALADKLSDHLACMRGTESAPARCVALGGAIGEAVKCHIYEWRPSSCHELAAGSDGCNRARIRWGMNIIAETA
jgi:uncharacterized protein